ncbi:septum formation protein Maf [bacterium]|nr:septum formation protein Maf [bacterium]
MVQNRFVLASASPRRRELLSRLRFKIPYDISDYEESNQAEDPREAARANALGKARDVAQRHPGKLVIGADTVVILDGHILGKPKDEADAAGMLELLSGREHEVVTALALVGEGERVEHSCTRVQFRDLSPAEIQAYVSSGEPMDKAGAYGIQGLAGQFVTRIEGCYFNVMGLPVELLTRMLRSC